MTYTRPENGNRVNIITLNGDEESIQILGETEIKLPKVEFADDTIKKYVVVEEHREDGIASVDFLYGKIDFEEISHYPDALEECMNQVVTRKRIDQDYKGCCGAMIDAKVNTSTGKLVMRVDVPTIKLIMDGVLRSSHRQIIKSKKQEPQQEQGNEALYKKLARSYRQAEEEYENNRQNRKPKAQRVFDKLFGRTQEEDDEEEQNLPLAQDADLDTDENLIVFFNTGLVIKDDEQILRYSISQKDPKTTEGKFLPLHSILMSNLDEEQLCLEGDYRDIFTEKICAVILYNSGENVLSALKWKWPYVGKFSPKDDLGVGTAKETQKFFSKISGVDRSNDSDDYRIL